jgi:phenylpyruvate tautomerase PptA (4-oxalocrotonate tautomerase family)
MPTVLRVTVDYWDEDGNEAQFVAWCDGADDPEQAKRYLVEEVSEVGNVTLHPETAACEVVVYEMTEDGILQLLQRYAD